METRTYTVYKFNELSEAAKEKAHSEYLSHINYFWMDENIETLKTFADNFNITIKNYEYDTHNGFVSFSLNCDDNILELKGERLARYFWNNHFNEVFRGKYYGKLVEDPKEKHGRRHVKRYSKVMYEMNCPTGYCIDYDILQPLYDFMHKPYDVDIESLFDKCFDAWLKAVHSDLQWQESMEYFEDHAEANDYDFEEDGSIA
jgi:hypothetical protein